MSKINFKKILKKNPFVLAPMDDVTDIAFRELCQEEGASYSTSELSSVEALIRGKIFKTRYEKGNLKLNSVQLFGSNPESFVKAADLVADDADVIDVNFGCPSACVTGNMSGSILLKDPKNVALIIEKLVKNIDKPISAKIRLGYEKCTYLQVAKEIEDSGASLIAVHGRTAKQKYSGLANWDAIAEIYNNSKIPIVGNGDIKCVNQIDKYLNSNCDALMIGRAAIGNPKIFKDFNYYKKFGKNEFLDEFKRKELQKDYFQRYLLKLDGRDFYNLNLKVQRQAMWFFKGFENVSNLRFNLSKTKNIDEIKNIIKNF